MSEPADNGQPTPPASITLIVGAMPHAQPGWNASLVMLAVQSARCDRRCRAHPVVCTARAALAAAVQHCIFSSHCCSPSEPAPAVFSRTNLHLDFLGAGAQPVTVEPSFTAPPNFTLVAPDDLSLVWNMAGDGCNIFARFGNLSLSAACNGPPLLWSADGYGPEGGSRCCSPGESYCYLAAHRRCCRCRPLPPPAGVLARWPAAWTGLHWFVHSLATPMRWRLESGGGAPALEGRALAHFEKNWGQRFPSAWHWAQGVNASWLTSAAAAESEAAGAAGAAEGGKKRRPRVQAAFTLAGGPPPSPLVPEGWVPNVWLLGVRTPTHR